MREIKFRAWDKEEKEMIYFDLEFLWGNGFKCALGCPLFRTENDVWKNLWLQNKPIMQYTGLKDKNGKEAYFDDIYRTKKGNIVIIDNSYRYNQMAQVEEDFDTQEPEIIGNIYENPEILENG